MRNLRCQNMIIVLVLEYYPFIWRLITTHFQDEEDLSVCMNAGIDIIAPMCKVSNTRKDGASFNTSHYISSDTITETQSARTTFCTNQTGFGRASRANLVKEFVT